MVEKILGKGNIIGKVTAPDGRVCLIYELIESRGYQTDYMPKAFRYIRVPHNSRVIMCPLKKATLKYWDDNGFKYELPN
jgi:hypothetical protein